MYRVREEKINDSLRKRKKVKRVGEGEKVGGGEWEINERGKTG